ncbi:cytochrome b [Litorisediminicola beolgyonensis]|uniref:Cytochrome b n=1 Tax=Litorisediminicola beolgyonensis TaxID=1173614 RepID=A0ABW3ZEQ9_9RHOB
MPSQRPAYSALQIGLHWLTALLVIAAWLTSDGMHRVLEQKLEGSYQGTPLHVALGLSVLTVVGIRLVVRLREGAPGPQEDLPVAHAQARHWGHVALYALMIGVPLGGFAAWFAGLDVARLVHGFAGNTLLALAGGHAVIALYHHYVRKDGTLLRMMRPGE